MLEATDSTRVTSRALVCQLHTGTGGFIRRWAIDQANHTGIGAMIFEW